MEPGRASYPWEQQQAGSTQVPPQQQQTQSGVFLPPHLRGAALPQQQQVVQQQPAEPSGMSGLMGLLAAHRGQPQPQPQPQPAQPQQLPQQLLPPHLQQQQPQQAPLAQPPQQPQPQQLGGPPMPGPQAAAQPLPASGNSSTSGPAAGPRPKAPPPGFKTPPPGFAPAPAGGTALLPQQQPQQLGQASQADNRAAGTALLAALRSSPVAAQGSLPPHLQGLQASAGAPPPAAAQAPAGPSPAPPAAQQQHQRAAAAAGSSSQPQPQLQLQPLPRPTLQQWRTRLQAEVSSADEARAPAPCNLKEGLKWLAGFAPEAYAVLDEQFDKYFAYIRDKHNPHVLTCVVFFCLGHHDYCRGATANLDLFHADHPAKVLNQRVSFYRLLFINKPDSKAAMMASLIAHRPDIATWVSDATLRQLFAEAAAGDVETVVAALLMLPEGWERLLGPGQEPHTWLGRYVKAVQQEPDNADKMSGWAWRKADAARQAAAAARAAAAAGLPAPAGSAAAASSAAAAAGQSSGGWGHVMSVARGGQQPAAGSAAAAAASPPNSSLLQGLLQQQLADKAAGQQQGAAGAGAGAGAGVQPRSQSTPRPAEVPAVSKDVIQMAIVQLTKDCPHVAKYLNSDLLTRVRGMPGPVALAVLGALNDLPQGWDKGHKQPAKHLAAVAASAEAYARGRDGGGGGGSSAAAGGGDGWGTGEEEGDGWVTAGKAAAGGGPSSSSSNGNALAAGGSSSMGSSAAGLWTALERERPEVWRYMQDRHMALIRPLTQEQQAKVLTLLLSIGHKTVTRAQEPEALLYSLITNHVKLLTQPLPAKVQEGLQRLADAHPDVIAHMDEGVCTRIASMPTAKAVVVLHSLYVTEWTPGWETRCNNTSAYLMGAISRALREAGM